MAVTFLDPADPYLQAERSTKYGILIITMVFVAGLLVEFITKKKIHIIQYAVIGLSLALFYALLLAFSEFILFGLSYLIAALMTTIALTLYFRGILKNKAAYLLGIFVALFYAINFVLLQLENFALLSGTLILFILLSTIMYFTRNSNIEKEEQPQKEALP